MSRHRTARILSATIAASATATLALGAAAGAADASSSRPPRLEQEVGGGHAGLRAAALPDHRRNPGLRAILSEEDADRGGEAPTIEARCRDYIDQPNPYRDPAPNVDQIFGDSIVPVGSQQGCSSAQNENTIAVNPQNPDNLVAGANDYRLFNDREQRNDSSGVAYTSFDGGKSWTNVQLPHLTYQSGGTGLFAQMDSAGDPVVAFGPKNTVYYGNIVFSRGAPTGNGTEAQNAIVLNVSHDGGLHWDEPTVVQADGVTPDGKLRPTRVFNDKIWLAADRRNGRVYVTWTRFLDTSKGGYAESPIVIASSSDFGKTFGPRTRIDTTKADFTPGGLTPYSQGSNPQVGRDGTLYVAYEGEQCQKLSCNQFGTTDRDVTVVARSTDHGQTFTKSIVDTNYDFPFNEQLGTPTLTGENFRVNSFPQLAYDDVSGALALTWADDRHGQYDATTGESLQTNGDNLLTTSADGITWSPVSTLGTPEDEVFGAVAFNQYRVAVTSYTRGFTSNDVNLDYAYWAAPGAGLPQNADVHRITTQASNPRIQFAGLNDEGKVVQGLFIGDYTGVALGSDGVLHPSWTDFRGRPGVTKPNQDAYTQAIQLGAQ